MAKYGEIVALLEYMDRKKDKAPKGFFKKKSKERDPFQVLQDLKAASQAYETWIEEQAKLKKKEEKKEDKKGWDALSPIAQAAYLTLGIQLMAFMWLSFFMKFKGI